MLYAERHRPRGVGLAGAVLRTWAVAEKNDWQFSNPRIDTVERYGERRDEAVLKGRVSKSRRKECEEQGERMRGNESLYEIE